MTPSVAVCYLHAPDHVATSFHHSLLAMMMRDQAYSRRVCNLFPSFASAMGIPSARNVTTRRALNFPGVEWVLWIDSDMGFEPDTLDRLLEAADPDERPIVGGLCFAQLYEQDDVSGFVPATSDAPTLYTFVPGTNVFERWSDWPRGEVVECDATGAAMLLVHRSVFDKIAEDGGCDCWFTLIDHPRQGGPIEHFGEDVSFCLRARGNGFKVHVDTSVKTSHLKPRWVTDRSFDRFAPFIPNFVVIPTKGVGPVRDLVEELLDQGEAEQVFVMDNGMPKDTRRWLEASNRGGKVTVIDTPDVGIHRMWNLGLQAAQVKATRANIALLNDDIEIGPRFLSGLGAALRAQWNIGAVCANYDGREGTGVLPVAEICAGRYDGTGGFAGFAFMVRGESTYLFPEDMKWWYGDNDLMFHHLSRERIIGIALDVEVTHLDGGSQTGDWEDPEMVKQLEADRAAFNKRWKLDG